MAGWLPGYGLGGGGGVVGETVVLDYALRSSLVNNGIDNGAIVMAGEFMQVPISTATRQNGFAPALQVGFPLPPELLDGSAYGLRWSVKFGSTPAADGILRANVGLYGAGSVGIGGGIEHRGGGLYRPNASVLSNVNVGGITQAQPEATGIILLPGLWNNSNSVGGACAAQVNLGNTGSGAAIQNGQGSYSGALELVAAFGSGSLTGATDVADVRIAYQLLMPWSL